MLERFAKESGLLPRAPEPARPDDLEAVMVLVHAAELPTSGIADNFPGSYSVVRVGNAIVAVAGLEAHGGVGLLRSVAVASSERGAGLGRQLVEDRLRIAREQKLSAVYLLTTTAAEYFRSLGFSDASRQEAPDDLRRSSEFASVCPSSAVCLQKQLS